MRGNLLLVQLESLHESCHVVFVSSFVATRRGVRMSKIERKNYWDVDVAVGRGCRCGHVSMSKCVFMKVQSQRCRGAPILALVSDFDLL